MGQGLNGLARTRREGEEETRGQEDEEENGNKDICIERRHFFLEEKVYRRRPGRKQIQFL